MQYIFAVTSGLKFGKNVAYFHKFNHFINCAKNIEGKKIRHPNLISEYAYLELVNGFGK